MIEVNGNCVSSTLETRGLCFTVLYSYLTFYKNIKRVYIVLGEFGYDGLQSLF